MGELRQRDDVELVRRKRVGVGDALLPDVGGARFAVLVGVAAINRDSGTWSGQCFTFGGRVQVRNILYMATLPATRWNEPIKAYYGALVRRGNPKKVALGACMRKLIIHLNGVLRDVSTPTHAAPTTS